MCLFIDFQFCQEDKFSENKKVDIDTKDILTNVKAGLETVLSYTEYYKQISTNNNIKIIILKPVFI